MREGLEALLVILFVGGCTVGITSPVVSPIAILILLLSATLRARITPYFRIALITGFLLLISHGAAFSSSDQAANAMFQNYIAFAIVSFAIMGIQLGFTLHSSAKLEGCLDIFVRAAFLSFCIGYLLLGIMVLILIPYQNSSLRDLFGAIWLTALAYPGGVFLIPALAACLTKLSLSYYLRFKMKPP